MQAWSIYFHLFINKLNLKVPKPCYVTETNYDYVTETD